MYHKYEGMANKELQVVLSMEANEFVRFQPFKVQEKISYNIRRLESGVIDKDLFKKLDGSDIWELRTLFNGICYRLFTFWDTEKRTIVVGYPRNREENAKDPQKRDRKGGSYTKGIF